MTRLTVNLTTVGAAVEEYSSSLRAAVIYLVFVDFEVITTLRCDDTMVHVVIDLVVGDGEVVRVVVGVETVLVVVVHLVVRPHAALMQAGIAWSCN